MNNQVDINTPYLFACDLDNTLIHSYKYKVADDVCIEIYNDREQSFISSRAIELLGEVVKKILWVPVTTRSIEQYNRIQWNSAPKYAVVSNGANLLDEGRIDNDWWNESLTYIQPYEDELKRQCSLQARNENFSICRIVDGSFLFLKCYDKVDTAKCAAELQSDTNLTVQHSGRKIYLFPPKLNKGTALLRLQNKLSPTHTICAGDSAIDIPMLDVADIAYVPSNLISEIDNKLYREFKIAEDILENILESEQIF